MSRLDYLRLLYKTGRLADDKLFHRGRTQGHRAARARLEIAETIVARAAIERAKGAKA